MTAAELGGCVTDARGALPVHDWATVLPLSREAGRKGSSWLASCVSFFSREAMSMATTSAVVKTAAADRTRGLPGITVVIRSARVVARLW